LSAVDNLAGKREIREVMKKPQSAAKKRLDYESNNAGTGNRNAQRQTRLGDPAHKRL
jgi:hypothetical protein